MPISNERGFSVHYNQYDGTYFLCFVRQGRELVKEIDLPNKKLPSPKVLHTYVKNWIEKGMLPEDRPEV